MLPNIAVKNIRTSKSIPFKNVCVKRRTTLLCFWGTWCAHGKHQLNDIAVAKKNWDKALNVDVVAIATDEDKMAHLLLPYITAKKWNFDCYIDEGSRLKQVLKTTALPYLIIVAPSGQITYTHTGYINAATILTQLQLAAHK